MTTSLKKGLLYDFVELTNSGYRFGRLPINRELSEKNIASKINSINKIGGTVSPIIVISAKTALDNNLDVLDDKGSPVAKDSSDLDKIIVIIEGQHRVEAIKKLMAEGGHSIKAYVMMLERDNSIPQVLQEANNSLCLWNGIDWLTSLASYAKENSFKIDSIDFVKELKKKDDMSDSAAWLWAKDEIISKATIIRLLNIASGSTDKKANAKADIKAIVEDNQIVSRKEIYKAAHTKLGNKIVGLKIIPSRLVLYRKNLVDKEDMRQSEAWEHIQKFIEGLDDQTTQRLKDAKKSSKKTKDQNLQDILDEAWNKYSFQHIPPKKNSLTKSDSVK